MRELPLQHQHIYEHIQVHCYASSESKTETQTEATLNVGGVTSLKQLQFNRVNWRCALRTITHADNRTREFICCQDTHSLINKWQNNYYFRRTQRRSTNDQHGSSMDATTTDSDTVVRRVNFNNFYFPGRLRSDDIKRKNETYLFASSTICMGNCTCKLLRQSIDGCCSCVEDVLCKT